MRELKTVPQILTAVELIRLVKFDTIAPRFREDFSVLDFCILFKPKATAMDRAQKSIALINYQLILIVKKGRIHLLMFIIRRYADL